MITMTEKTLRIANENSVRDAFNVLVNVLEKFNVKTVLCDGIESQKKYKGLAGLMKT